MKIFSISQRLALIAGLLIVAIIALVAVDAVSFHRSMVQERRDKIRDMTQSIVAMAKNYDAEVSAGHITLKEAQAEIKRAVGGMRWGQGDYFVIFQNDGVFLLHPNPKYENVNRLNFTDANGFEVIKAEIAAANAGGGYVDTVVPRANQTVATPKVLYAASYQPWNWVISTGAYIDDIDSTVQHQLLWMVLLGLVAMATAAGLSAYISRSISHPIDGLRGAMQTLAQGDTSVAVPFIDWRHETGEIARAVDVFRQHMIHGAELASEQQAEHQAKLARQTAIEKYVAAFEGRVGQSLDRLALAASEMRGASQNMSDIARQTSRQANAGAEAAEAASANVQTVASATEELSSSVAEIGRQVGSSTRIAGDAVSAANRTNSTVQGLSEAAQKIGDVVSLINDIASQTNLLALNATIEAARAGDAGKGFAVVASEVKSLANQTAKATEDISNQVSAMQEATSEAVRAIEGISGTIGSINEITTAIASAVEEQGAATQEIARNVQEAAQRTELVSQTIVDVNQAAVKTGDTSSNVLSSSENVSRQADALRADIDNFLNSIRSA